jgi:hypothetical protein
MNSPKPSASVVTAAILAILGSLLAILGLSFSLIGFMFLPAQQNGPALPPGFKTIAEFTMVVFVGISFFGIATGIGLIRLKNWARISALVWAGITVVVGILAVASILLLDLPLNTSLPANSAATPVSMPAIKAMVAVIYGIPILVGAWWLILFNHKSVKAQFTGTAAALSEPAESLKPRCPLPIAIIAGLILFSVAGMFAVPLMHMPITLIYFGHRLQGELGAFVFASTAVLYLAAAIGLLTLKRWSYPLIFVLLAFGLTSMVVTLASPNYASNMTEIFNELHVSETTPGALQLLQSKTLAFFGFIPYAVFVGILLYYRTRFLQACAVTDQGG